MIVTVHIEVLQCGSAHVMLSQLSELPHQPEIHSIWSTKTDILRTNVLQLYAKEGFYQDEGSLIAESTQWCSSEDSKLRVGVCR